jgi:hypothetical protein
MAAYLDDEITLRLSRREIMTIGTALARYLDYWEDHAAADGYESHPAEQLEDIRQPARPAGLSSTASRPGDPGQLSEPRRPCVADLALAGS